MRQNTVIPNSIAMGSCENGTAACLQALAKHELYE